MTPKEKADELFLKFAMYLRANLMHDEDANEDAKQCALIAVDELTRADYLREEFWWEVKKEIENL